MVLRCQIELKQGEAATRVLPGTQARDGYASSSEFELLYCQFYQTCPENASSDNLMLSNRAQTRRGCHASPPRYPGTRLTRAKLQIRTTCDIALPICQLKLQLYPRSQRRHDATSCNFEYTSIGGLLRHPPMHVARITLQAKHSSPKKEVFHLHPTVRLESNGKSFSI